MTGMSKNDAQEHEKLPTESYKGVRDFYPEDQAFMNYLTGMMREVVEKFGYVEYHASILEPAELYKKKSSEEIVSEQTYTFVDRGGREVTLRPEMTPTVARMVAARRREFGFPLRLYSIPNVFRYERPQRGRLREHWQLNVDLFGSSSIEADVELITVAHALMRAFGAEDSDFLIKIGSRNFLNSLTHELKLSDEAGKKLFGLIDRKAKMAKEEFAREIADLGVAAEMLHADRVPEDVAAALEILKGRGITNATFAPEIVRGFDYYSGIVFEVFDTNEGNNRSLFGGGRYDNLTALFDHEQIPGVGFGMGDVTIKDFLEVRGKLPAYHPKTNVYIAVASSDMAEVAYDLAVMLRNENLAVAVDFGDKKLSDQIKAASKHKVPYLIVVGPDEKKSGRFNVKNLITGEESPLDKEELAEFFLSLT
jgi:histidyl-tRNA synthetase